MNSKKLNIFPAWAGNMTGAFADGALLFPLIIALSISSGMNSAVLLGSAGIFYILAGLFFKVPMPIQPLKSVAISAVALSATILEIRIATLLIGIFCLCVTLAPVEKWEKYIPRYLIHGVQFSLGVLLIMKGADAILAEQSFTVFAAIAIMVATAIFIQSYTAIPVLGIIAGLSMVWALIVPAPETTLSILEQRMNIDFSIILTLVLPQLALTMTNSVVGTFDAAQRYFGETASAVTLKKLLYSIGFGNLISAAIGGLPFCHGSGGMTAHVKAGAKDHSMNFYIGGFLLVLAVAAYFTGLKIVPHYPTYLVSALLSIIGWYHLKLAKTSWAEPQLRMIIITMGITTLLTSNILCALAIGLVIHLLKSRLFLRVSS